MNDEENPQAQTPRWRPFEEARAFVRALGLAKQQEYQEWSKAGNRPADIPGSPAIAYKEHWKGWGDFLGSGGVRPRRTLKKAKPFAEARAHVRPLGLKNQDEYFAWSKTEARPEDIPANPRLTYKEEWRGWEDWLGRTQPGPFRPFTLAREYGRSLGLQSHRLWEEHAKSPAFPADIPANPSYHYRNEGWLGWSDWLGHTNLWTRLSILAFLNSLLPVVPLLQPAELYAILRRNGLLTVRRKKTNTGVVEAIERLCTTDNPEAAAKALAALLGDDDKAEIPAGEVKTEPERTGEETDAAAPADLKRPARLPKLRSLAGLKAADRLVEARLLDDEDILEFLVNNRVAALWQEVLDDETAFTPERIRAEEGGPYFETIRGRFLDQYEGAAQLPLPAGYGFQRNGRPTPPNLMQRLAAYRLLKEKRLGNWSGVGAGKTISAVLASRVIGARLTVIVAANATLAAWTRVIADVFPDSAVFVRDRGEDANAVFPDTVTFVKELGFFQPDPARPSYFVANYESFQQTWAPDFVRDLVVRHKIDFVVLDEIQSARLRRPVPEQEESARRRLVKQLITGAADRIPDLRVLGMSATPVMSDLHEARTLLELITGEDLSDMPTQPTVLNAIEVHQRLIRHGIRYRPRYAQSIETQYPVIDGQAFLPELKQVPRRNVAALDKVVLRVKFPHLPALLRRGTLVYTQFVTDMVTPLVETVEAVGLRAGVFTGERKDGLDDFLQGKVDVLIGSAPVGTGVDGLQFVCNRLIFVSLPWTSADYEQVVGRLHRQGSVFDKVEVFIPLVEVRREGEDAWSWDRTRLQVIQFKRTLADAALDGVIPEGELPTRDKLQEDSLAALQKWIDRASRLLT